MLSANFFWFRVQPEYAMTGMRDEIISKFLEADLQVHPEVVLYLLESDDPSLIDEVIANEIGRAHV